jgi:hypothetical protein
MSFLKKLFCKKEEVIVEENSIEIPEGCFMCEHCDRLIHPYEKRKTMAGKKFHIKCFRKYKKQVAKMAFNC